jgi:hypothetical protein
VKTDQNSVKIVGAYYKSMEGAGKMKLQYKGVIALVSIFVIAGICHIAYACDGTRGGSERKTMDASGGQGFRKSCDQDFRGHNGDNGNHKGWEQGKHKGWDKAGHEGNRNGRHHRETSSGNDQSSTGTDTGSNQSALDPTNADTYPDSTTLLTQAWNSYNEGDYATAQAFANEAIGRYSSQAKEQQASLSGFAPEGSEAQYWALNDVATSLFIMGSAYKSQGNNTAALQAFNTIISEYGYAQCYDPAQDLYWKVAEGAQKELDSM